MQPIKRMKVVWLAAWAVCSCVPAVGAPAPEPRAPEFRSLDPLPALVEAARAAGMTVNETASVAARGRMAPGDAVTVLVNLSEGDELKQWLVDIEASRLQDSEKQRPASVARFFSNTGREHRFGSEPAALALRVLGPLTAADLGKKASTHPDVKRGWAVVSADYLGLGLDRVPATMLRVRALREADPTLPSGRLALGPSPFPPAVVAETRRGADAVGITEADERATAGSFLALGEFFQIAASTPGLADVLKNVIDVPWWSIVRSGGKTPAIAFEMLPGAAKLESREWTSFVAEQSGAYALPLELRLNGKPALRFQMAVVSPRPPLLVSAGIVGLSAARPNGKGPALMLRVIGTRLGAGE
jgi:hypothetical protein